MITLELLTEDECWTNTTQLEKLCQQGLNAANRKYSGEVAILLTSDEKMRELNQKFRNRDKPTDVLAFPADSAVAPFLGDIAIGYGVACQDATAGNKPLHNHVAHLAVHGFLHLIGYDHQTDEETAIMQDLERLALESIGIPDPYKSITQSYKQ